MTSIWNRARRWRTLLAAAAALVVMPHAAGATDVVWWHAMSGELGRQVETLATEFNATQDSYRIVPVYKGSYAETVNAAIFAFRSRTQPAIVQVNEIATATMNAAKGATYAVSDLMRDEAEAFAPSAYLPAIAGYYADTRGNMLSFPFNVSTPVLFYNKSLFRAAGLDADTPPKTWPEVGAAARRLRASGVPCGFTTSWPSWIHVENFSALHDVPIATRANGLDGLDAELVLDNPLLAKHVAMLAEWQKTKVFDYSGRATSAEPRFPKGECGIFLGSSATRADILAHSKFEVGVGRLPYDPDVKAAPQNSIIGGATLWVLRNRPRDEYKGVAKFFAYLSKPEVQAGWHQRTGYLPITRAAFELSKAQGFYERNPGAGISFEQLSLKPPTDNSRGVRLGSFLLIRDIIDDELEQAFAGKKSAKEALASADARGNRLLRQFERANPD